MPTLNDQSMFERAPTVQRLLKGFPSRIEQVRSYLVARVVTKHENREFEELKAQYGKVLRCVESVNRTNGKTFNNLLLASSKLNDLLVDWEHSNRDDLTGLHVGPTCDEPEYLARLADAGEPKTVRAERR